MKKKRVLLKITGEAFQNESDKSISLEFMKTVVAQIKQLKESHLFGIVLGGGNLFRGDQHGSKIGLSPATGHEIGMLATIMNSIMLQDLFKAEKINCILFSALPGIAGATKPTGPAIEESIANNEVLIFAGGLGIPFFTTDTTAVVRALLMHASEIWKGTKVDGIYSQDPINDKSAQKIDTIDYAQAVEKKLGVMDLTAFTMAEQHKIKIRVFNIFQPNALIEVAHNSNVGSTVL